jgi:phosphatidylglycerol:prolipoprotein diacylglycerol transferase
MPLFAIPYPVIDPVLMQIGPVSIRWYALSYIAGILLGWLYARRIVVNDALWGPGGSPITKRRIDDFVVFATLGIVIGGRLGYVFIYDLQHFVDQPLSIFALWEGGMSFHGALVGTVVAMALFARYTKIPVWSLVDIVATVTPIGLFLGRIANFINGELYGRVTDVPWAMVFPNGGAEPRHPSQLYESALEGFVLFWVLWFLVYRFKMLQKPAFLSGAFVAGYGAARTFAEFFRQPDIQIGTNGFIAPGITMGMLLSVPMVIIGVATMVWAARRKATPPASPKPAQKRAPARQR